MPRDRFLALALGAVAALCSALIIVWSRYRSPRRSRELCSRRIPTGETGEVTVSNRQVLVLGLDGAGKTSIIHKLCTDDAKTSTSPTQGFNSACITTEAFKMDLLEIGGSLNLRTYWNLYLKKAAVLVFVLDSANHQRLLLARQELHRLLDEAQELPLLVLANKQDKADAVGISEMHQQLALHRFGLQRKVTLLGTSATAEERGATHRIQDVKTLLTELLS
ncbi:ADP-ribosylation factor-like protein 10 [Ambystoma mexicanum]|uniref:ADP-ribosylation factor-like protein 10 n=1 Tax=Ambystoma mexicanum TaxID=8296 RepID=UPI0037E84C6F